MAFSSWRGLAGLVNPTLRPGMTEDRLRYILSRQMPDKEKRRRADVLVQTGQSRHVAQRAIRRLVRELRA